MCGIIGYIGTGTVVDILQQGLLNLEYRGYDSAGVALNTGAQPDRQATDSHGGDGISVYKREGRVEELIKACPSETAATSGIGHTRWSTHGPPTDVNAHPHTSTDGTVAVVHNGIIENYETLRAELSEDTFVSDTDTEVIPHLIAEHLAAGEAPRVAVASAVDRLAGSFAFAATIAGTDRVFAVRKDSPLVIGHGEDGMYLGSDVTAFIDYTREVTYLQDGDIAVLAPDGIDLYRDGTTTTPDVTTIEWEAEAAEKSGYDHYMLKEINEQPTALRQTISGRVNTEAGDAELDIELPQEYLNSLEEIQIVACGTSFYAGEYAARLLESIADVRTSVTVASEYSFTGGRDPWRTLTIAVTQSGETADTLSAIRAAKKAGSRTLAVTNTLGSTVTRVVDDSVFIRAGPEIGVAATKTFASQVATLALLAIYIGRQRGALAPGEATELLEALRAVPGAIQHVLDATEQIQAAAEQYADHDAFFFIGRQFGYPVALEGALKLKEISYDHAEGFRAGELKHGPLALVTEDTPVLALLTEGANADKTLNNIKEVQARGAPVLGITSTAADDRLLDAQFTVPAVGVFEPLVANVYFQLFAYHVAALKDRAIDKPRNLAKSVTVE
jgi:glucosamine--fructose-6-phosphate aminotransferase (isomerizing)